MNADKKIQVDGHKVGTSEVYFPNDQVSVTDKISYGNVDEFDEIDEECQCKIVNYGDHDGDNDDINSNNKNDYEVCYSQVAGRDGESGDDYNKDHCHSNDDYDGNRCVDNLDSDDTFCPDDEDNPVGDEDGDSDCEDISYSRTKAEQDDDQIVVTKAEDSANKNNSASEYFTCADDDDDHDILGHADRRTNKYRDSHGKISKLYSSVQLTKCGDLCNNKQYGNVMNMLEGFQDQSEWEKHQRLTFALQKGEIDIDLKIVLLLEQGMAEILQKHFSLGKKLFRQAMRLCSQSKSPCLLQGRALMFLGNAYRKEGPVKYGKAFNCLTLAQQNLFLVESKEDQAELNYFLGVLYLNMLNISIREPSQRSRDRIEKHYQAVYDYAMAESASRVRDKIQRIFPLGMANFLLDGQTELARSRVVPETKLKKAEDCLAYFAHHFPFDEQPVTMQTDYCKSLSDLEYRKGHFHTSQELLWKGLKIAKMHGYHLEVQSLEKRLLMLEKCFPRVCVCLPLEDTANLADQSCTANSDMNVFSSGSE